jgi:precorrin-6A synthase
MTELTLIGMGAGDPGHLTLAAVQAIRAADLILIPEKDGKEDLADLRRVLLADILPDDGVQVRAFAMPDRDRLPADYPGTVQDWHDRIAGVWHTAMAGAARVALLVWGDPGLYDSTLRIARRLPGLTVRVIPGITAIQALTAAFAIPLNTLGGAVAITTGRRLRDHGWPAGADSVVVMLDGQDSFRHLDGPAHVWWGVNVGRPEQVLIAGPLPDTADRLTAAKAAVRAQVGWAMDIYLLRRTLTDD